MGEPLKPHGDEDVYRVQMRWATRHGVTVWRPTRWWRRTWQIEWPGAQRAYRGWTRNGAIRRGVRARREARRG